MQDQLPIALGQRVEIELISKSKKREKLQFVLVADEAADFDKGFLGISTPLAQTILGHTAGEMLEYPRGDIVRVKILAVQPSEHAPAADAAEQRDETLRRARDKAELANMVSFALTFDSKWGDYDPEMIVENFEKKDDA
ncbi:MAG TPA: GreA/GreB family elongation factor [Anaerolineae bacterium]|nr:GreA/GreB family elongation factor [Anaerolineae bacterium]